MGDDAILRDVQEEDFSVFFDHQDDPISRHMVAFSNQSTHDRAGYLAHWQSILATDPASIKKTLVWEGQVVGYMVCFERDGKRQVGYYLGREHWGKGLATRALRELLTIVDTRPLYAGVAHDNVGSRRVLEKCGFAVVGEERSFARSRGEDIRELILRLDE